MMEEMLKANPLMLQIPVKNGDDFIGFVDVIKGETVIYDKDRLGVTYSVVNEIPDGLKERYNQAREVMLEKLSEIDDGLMESYLEGLCIDEDEIKSVIRKGTLEGKIIPVLCGSAFKNKGIQALLDALVDYLPSPADISPYKFWTSDGNEGFLKGTKDEPFSGLVFKIMNDPFVGHLSYIRIYSGSLNTGDSVLNSSKDKTERIGRVLRLHANKREEIRHVESGDICAVVGLKGVTTGDTLCQVGQDILYENIEVPQPVLSCAIAPKKKDDLKKMWLVFNRYTVEDPSLNVRLDSETGEVILSGMGELHLDIVMNRAKREHNLEMISSPPQVAYRETITKSSQAVGKYIKQSGGKGQYGHVVINITPTEGTGFIFENKIIGGAIPKEYISSVEAGIREALEKGVVLGYPVIDIKVELLDGSYHEVDSSELAFKLAGSIAVKEGIKKSNPILLEPVMKVDVNTPNEFLGSVVGDLSSRRGKIAEIGDRNGYKSITAYVPLEEMFGYTTNIRSITQGRGNHTMEFFHYAPVPQNIFENIIKDREKIQTEVLYG